jgi:ABC-type dipeptide/oligopeptide/nickel transport system permease component
MLLFIVRRLFYGLLVIIGVTIVVFCIFHVLPGDPADAIAGRMRREEDRQQIRKAYHLDRPVAYQLLLYFNDLSFLSAHENTPDNEKKYHYQPLLTLGNEVFVAKVPYLRESFQSHQPVSQIILNDLKGTLWLAVAAMVFATVLGVGLGLVSALNQSRWLDHTLLTTSVLGISAPSFISAIVIQVFFGYYLSEWTGLPGHGSLFEKDANGVSQLYLKNLVLPAITLGIRPLAIIMQITRNSMIDVLGQDFIRTAKAKGANWWSIIFKHALKNALNPVITAVTGWLASLMAGAFFVEYIFNYHGLGYDTIEAVKNKDLPVVMGATITVAIFFVVINIFVDLLYALIDPRIKLN